MSKKTIEDDVKELGVKFFNLQSEAKAFSQAPDSSYRFEMLCAASTEVVRAVMAIKERKASK